MSDVIACIDGTSLSTAVSDAAAWAALRLDAPLQLLHVLDRAESPTPHDLSGSIGFDSRELLLQELAALDEKRGKIALEQGRLMLEAAAARAVADGVTAPQQRQRHGDLIETLVEQEQSTRLLVMGKHDHHLHRHIGSRLESVVRTLHAPILVTPPTFQPPQRVMIAFDGSTTSRKAVDRVAGSPLLRGLPVHLVMVAADTPAHHNQMAWARHTLEANEVSVTTALVPGEVERALCDYRQQQGVDLMVMGAYGHSVIRRFLVGSTTTNMIRDATIPVLLLR